MVIIPTLPAGSKKLPVPGTGEVGVDESPAGFARRMPECCDSTILTLMSVFLSQNTQGSARAAEGGRAEPQAPAKALHDLAAECLVMAQVDLFLLQGERLIWEKNQLFSIPFLPLLSLCPPCSLPFPSLCFSCLSFPPLLFPFLLKEL